MPGPDASIGGEVPDQTPKAKKGCGFIGCLGVLLVGGVIFALFLPSIIERAAGGKTEEARALSVPLQEKIQTALRGQGFPAPASTEIANDYLVVTFQLDSFAPKLTPRAFGEEAVVIVRNAMQGTAFDKFRVTLNGPPPGPGLIRRYGSARYSEGSRVSWEEPK
jgi:hypothetical protein